jgi:hypothetical protein
VYEKKFRVLQGDVMTVITDTVPLVLVPLPSGDTAAVVYTATLGDICIGLLLLALLMLSVLHHWRMRRTA